MEIVKKTYIRIVAVLLAVVIAVSTPLSNFADTQGIRQTEAMGATTLITIGNLFGALAGAYGLYIGLDKLADKAEDWFNWTASNNLEAYTDLQTIKEGAVRHVISKALLTSVADYLSTEISDKHTYTTQGVPYSYNNLPDTLYTDSLISDVLPSYPNAVFVKWKPSSMYESGSYQIYYTLTSDSNVSNILNSDKLDSYSYYMSCNADGTFTSSSLNLVGFDSNGLSIGTVSNSSSVGSLRSVYAEYKSSGWDMSGIYKATSGFNLEDFFSNPLYFVHPVYLCTSWSITSKQQLIDSSIRYDTLTVDYKTHGNNALDNTNALEGQEITQAQLDAIQQAVASGYADALDGPITEEDELDAQKLADIISLATLNALLNLGFVNKPSDVPTDTEKDGILSNILDTVISLPQQIADVISTAITSALEALFVPDTAVLESMLSDFGGKFPWVNDLFDYFRPIRNIINNYSSSPPIIYIHFENSDNPRYKTLGTMKVFDGNWYAPYKPIGDAIISAFLWLFFIWKLIKNIPNIINGTGMVYESYYEFDYAQSKAFGSAVDGKYRKG